MTALAVAVAAGVGAALRHLVSRWLAGRPVATLLVNLTGSLLAGAALGADVAPATEVVLLAGLCGGLTTLSTWAVEVLGLHRSGRPLAAVAYAVGTLLLCVGAAALGRAAF